MVSSSGSESGGGAAGQRSSRLAALVRWAGRRSGSAAERLGGGTDGRLGGWVARRLAGWRAGTNKFAFLNLKKKFSHRKTRNVEKLKIKITNPTGN